MSVTVKTNRAAWESAVERAADKAAEALAVQMMNDSLDKIPRQEGTLRDSGRVEKSGTGERDLVWSNVYAGYQWYGMRADGTHVVRHYTTSGTGKMWVEQARAANMDKWQKTVQNAFSEGLK
ncbi:minor capsid protein [Ruthenibacterium lactatiformans]|uniref:minor capsid protein n=1 Tax=Ruthenibacterium lactatiformans TaxID=1550024 RepID=UPI0026736916|nr:minor capsid protein [Ruthenibacterium lactatiformans]